MTKPQKKGQRIAPKRGKRGTAKAALLGEAFSVSPGDDVLTKLAQELLGVCVPTFKSFGANPGDDTLQMLQSFPPRAKFARQLLEDAGTASMVHTRWQSDPKYLDGEGHPRIIPMRGPSPSFQALCRECGVAVRSTRLLEWACRFGLCRRAGVDRLAYLSDMTLLTGHPALMLARAVITTDRFLATCIHNARQRRRDVGPLGDRTTQVRVSDEAFPQVAKVTRRFLSSFIESSDRQLLATVAGDRRTRSGRKRWCGVSAFVFHDR